MDLETLVKLADLFDGEAQKLEKRPTYEVPSHNEQEILDKVNGVRYLLDRVRLKMQRHKSDLGWWNKFWLNRKINQIEDRVRELDAIL